jgi:hypothetical protein
MQRIWAAFRKQCHFLKNHAAEEENINEKI